MLRIATPWILLLALALVAGCSRKTSDDSKKGSDMQGAQQGGQQYLETPVTPDPSTAQASPTPPPQPPQPPQLGPERAGAHILLAYKGSAAAKPDVTRSKEEALALAKQLLAEARKNPASFADLAKKNSACPSSARGGILGAWPKGRMVPEFDTAIDGLKVGEISEPVETRFGYHLIRRLETRYAGRHILIAFKGAQRAKDTITRTKQEALALAKQVAVEAKKNPGAFAEMAKKHSDDSASPEGGSLGEWQPGRMVLEFQTAVEAMPMDAISDPVESPFGFHVIQRQDPASVAK